MLINGHEIIRTIIEKDVPEGQEDQQAFYNLQVRTRDASGAQRTELDISMADSLYIDAWIEASGPGANPANTGPIEIELVQGGEYVYITEGQPGFQGRTVVIQPSPQAPASQPSGPAVVVVSAMLDGQPFSAPVNITITRTEYELKFI